MKYDELSGPDKEAVDFMSKLDTEGGIEGLWRYNGLKNAPLVDAKVWKDLAIALAAADKLVQKYARIADTITYEDD